MRVACLAVLAACGTSSDEPHVLLDFTRAGGLYTAPVPADDLTAADFPDGPPMVDQVRALLAGVSGFATTAGVYFAISDELDPATLPSIAGSVAADASVFVVGVDPASPDFGVRYPLEVSFRTDAGKYGAPNLLAALPLQGVPLRPATRYAAVVTTAVHALRGPLAPAPASVLARFPEAAGVVGDDVAGITAFTTGDPTAELRRARDAALARPLPAIDAPFARTDVFDDFCVYHTTIAMPDWQTGAPPFDHGGGTWQLDAAGAPIFQRTETANLTVTIPRRAAPSAGYPLVVFVRTGGGGDRPLVDRGQQPATGADALVPGEGPARYLARAGFAGIEVDGPLGGLRNTTQADEQFTTFNVTNLGAMRDNIRESAVELDVIAHVGVALQLDAADCAGATAAARFDAGHVAIMGHSMGAWIAPLAAAHEPLFGALILSGAGGSWIENIMYKAHPLEVRPIIATLVQESELRADDPVLSFAQWALEPSDPAVYGAAIAPRHVLMVQGVVDNYILPRIANATSLAMRLDLAGPEHDDAADPRLADELALGPLLPLVGRGPRALPVAGNANGATAVVTQHVEDGIEDGHEVLFQTDVPKHEVQCFLASWLAGTPTVPVDGTRDAPCL